MPDEPVDCPDLTEGEKMTYEYWMAEIMTAIGQLRTRAIASGLPVDEVDAVFMATCSSVAKMIGEGVDS